MERKSEDLAGLYINPNNDERPIESSNWDGCAGIKPVLDSG